MKGKRGPRPEAKRQPPKRVAAKKSKRGPQPEVKRRTPERGAVAKSKRGRRPEPKPKAKPQRKVRKSPRPRPSRKKTVSRPKLPRQAAFLAALARTGRIGKAAAAVPVDRNMHYRWLRDDAGYKTLFEGAMERAVDAWEDEAARRATGGTVKPVFWKGHRCGGIREYSDGLLQFLLKGARPEKYRDRMTTEHVTPEGRPMESEITIRLVRPSDPGGVSDIPAGA